MVVLKPKFDVFGPLDLAIFRGGKIPDFAAVFWLGKEALLLPWDPGWL